MANPTGSNQVLTKIYRLISNAIRVYIVNPGDISGGGTVTTPTITNFNVASANTEETYTFTSGTKRFALRSRMNGKLKLAYEAGDTFTNYFTLNSGCTYEEVNLDLSQSIYFQSNKSSDIIEIISWV
jgi:hypothetical protein